MRPFAIAIAAIAASIVALTIGRVPASAGPPFETDDPEPVDFHHIEIDLAEGRQGEPALTGPIWEIDYGPVHNVEISAAGQPDELQLAGAFRFVHESKDFPEIGFLPEVTVKSDGEKETFLPFWGQKTIGAFTVFGGGGVSHGDEFTGATVMRNFISGSGIGVEYYHESQHNPLVPVAPRFAVGYVDQQGPSHALMFWIGRQLTPQPGYYFYAGVQQIIAP